MLVRHALQRLRRKFTKLPSVVSSELPHMPEAPGLCDLRQLVHIVEFVIDDERRNGFVEIRNGRFLMPHWKKILFNYCSQGKAECFDAGRCPVRLLSNDYKEN